MTEMTTTTRPRPASPPVDAPSRVGRNVAAALIGQLLTWAMSFAVVLFLPAYLGPTGMGRLSLATAFASVLMAIVPLGTSMALVKEVARNPDRAIPLLRASLLLRCPISILATGLAYLAALAMPVDHETAVLVLVCAGGTLLAVTNDAVASTLQGLERIPRQNLVAVVEKLVWSGLTVLAVVLHSKLWQIAAVSWVSSAIATAGNLSAFRADIRNLTARRDPVRTAEVRSMIQAGLPFLGWSVCVALYGQVDPMILRIVSGRDLDIGWYGVTTKLVGATLFLPAALSSALIPRLSKLHADGDDEAFDDLARRALSIAVLIGVPLAVFIGSMPHQILSMLPYKGKFAAAAPVLGIGGAGLILWYVGIVLGTFVIARDGQRRLFRSAAVAAIVGLPLCLLLSRWAYHALGNAAIGAISSDCIVELGLALSYALLLRGRKDKVCP